MIRALPDRCVFLFYTSTASLAARSQLSIDICCLQGAQQQTRRTPLLLSIDGKDRRTDGRTDK